MDSMGDRAFPVPVVAPCFLNNRVSPCTAEARNALERPVMVRQAPAWVGSTGFVPADRDRPRHFTQKPNSRRQYASVARLLQPAREPVIGQFRAQRLFSLL